MTRITASLSPCERFLSCLRLPVTTGGSPAGRRSRHQPRGRAAHHSPDRSRSARRARRDPDSRHQRLPRSDRQDPTRRRGRRRGDGRRRQPAAAATNPNTVFAAAGDLIGASTFESFIAEDKPTIDALNEAGLEVSSVGNHEFDQGYDDLINRVMAPYDATTNPDGGADWQYLAANVEARRDNDLAIPDDLDQGLRWRHGRLRRARSPTTWPSWSHRTGSQGLTVTEHVDATNARPTS